MLVDIGRFFQAFSPDNSPGQNNLSITVAGQSINFIQGTTSDVFGPGLTVSSVSVTSPTSATAVINIDPTAQPGPCNLTASWSRACS